MNHSERLAFWSNNELKSVKFAICKGFCIMDVAWNQVVKKSIV